MIDPGKAISPGTLPSAEEELPALPIWAFTLGIFALLTFGLTAVPSIICGHIALARTRKDPGTFFVRSVAWAGLVIGYLGTAVFGTWIVVATRHLIS